MKDEGNAFYKNKQFEEAIKKYDEAIELKPTEILYYNNKAAVHLEQNHVELALEVVNNAIAIADDNMIYDFVKRGKLYARKAACYMKQSDYTNASEWY